MIDFYKRWVRDDGDEAHLLWVSKVAMLFWAVFAVDRRDLGGELGSLIEVVNRFGSFFYGSILGVFLLAIGWKRANSTGAFVGADCRHERGRLRWRAYTKIAFLWHNLIGAVGGVRRRHDRQRADGSRDQGSGIGDQAIRDQGRS